MPTAIVEAIVLYAYEGELVLTAAELGAIATVLTVAVTTLYSQAAQRRAKEAARDAYNSTLRDRYIMTRQATAARQIVLGRARVSGPMFFVGSYGAAREHLTFMVALAAHEIDAVEQVYFDDLPVVLDGSGNVLGVTMKEVFSVSASGSIPYTINSNAAVGTVTAQAVYGTTILPLTVVSVVGTTVTISGATNGVVGVLEIRYQPDPSPFRPMPHVSSYTTVALNGSGNGSVTLPQPPVAGTLSVTDGTGASGVDLTSFASVVGNVVTVTGGTPSITASVQYQYLDTVSRARVRTMLGAPGQVADAATITNFPGVWTSAHTATGIAYLIVELDYDPTAFPGGIPNVSALVRGAKVYDPRTGLTAWSDNVALMMRHYALSPLGGRMASSLVNDTKAIAAANVCDTVTNYVVNGQTYTRALYRGGTAAPTTARPQDVLNDLAQAMAGKWAFVDGQLCMKAGSFTTPVLTLDETWLHEGQPVHVQPKRARSDVVNQVTATFVDEAQSYQVVQMPQVAPAAYLAEDGVALPLDLTLASVQFNGQAQHVAGCLLRDARAGIQLTVLCNMKAYPLELFDVIYVTLSRFGWVNKTFEVLDISWSFDGGIQLALKETDATITAVGAAFLAFDAGKATRLPSPFKVAAIAGLNVTSGSSVMAANSDGTVVQRMLATWTAATDPGILDPNGGIEIRYGLSTLPDTQWTSIFVDGHLTQAYLPNVQFDKIYLIKVRGFNALASGNWSLPAVHKVSGVNTALDTVIPVFNSAVNGSAFHGVTGYIAVDGTTFTPTKNFTAEVTCFFEGLSAVAWDGQHYVIAFCDPTADMTGSGPGAILGGSAVVDSPQSMTATRAAYSCKGTFALTAGVPYTLGLASHENPASTGNQIWNLKVYITLIAR